MLVKTFADTQMVFTSRLMDEGLLAPASRLSDTLLVKCVCVCVFSKGNGQVLPGNPCKSQVVCVLLCFQ